MCSQEVFQLCRDTLGAWKLSFIVDEGGRSWVVEHVRVVTTFKIRDEFRHCVYETQQHW